MALNQRRVWCHLVGLLLLISATTALKCPERDGTPGREIVCYTKRNDLELLENAICRCTTLVHQGHDLQHLDASEVKSLRDGAKEANPGIRVLLSVNDKQEILKSSAKTRQEAAVSLTEILKEVDGVELNVTAGSKERLVTFVKGLKDEMVNKSLEKMILLALPTKPEDLAKQFELKELSKYVDLFTVATHYLRDSDEAYRAFHPSRLMGLFDMLNTDSIVDLISGMGAPKQKILISAPASAYQFTLRKVDENTPRSPVVEEQPASFDRKKLCDAMSDGEWTVERDEDLTAPYAFKNTTWIAFEDETSLKIKGKYVILRELAGMALRDVENDLKNDCGMSVAQSVQRAFTEMKRKTREVVLSSLEKDLKGSAIAYPRHVRSSDFRIVRVVDTAGKIRAVRENTQTAFACPHQGYFVHPKSCNRFYRCVKFNQEKDDYSVFEFDCPAGLAFDERTEVCVWPGSLSRGSACPGSSEIEPVARGRFRCPSRAGFYADPHNCRWFFACYDLGGSEMVPYEFRCPFGLVFDESRLVCEWPWKVPNCDGPGHGDGHSIYTYGGSYEGQGGYVPQGGIVGVGGFVGQGGFAGHDFADAGVHSGQGGQGTAYNAGAYDEQNYNAAGSAGAGAAGEAGYDEQSYNAAGAGAAYDGQTYNAAGGDAGYDGQAYAGGSANAGSGADYDSQTYNAGGAGNVGVNYDGQFNNAAGADSALGGQAYNTAGVAGPEYNGPSGGAAEAGAGYDTQSYNAGGSVSSDGKSYNIAGAGDAGAAYDGQAYNAGGAGNTGSDYNGQTYNAGGASNFGADYDGQTYNSGGAGNAGAGYDGQTFNAAGGSAFNPNGAIQPNYNGAGATGYGADYEEQNYNGGGATGAGINYDGQKYNGAGLPASYDGQGFNRPAFPSVDKPDCDNGQNFNGDGRAPSGFAGQGVVDNDKGIVTTSSDYDDRVGVNNFAGNTRLPTGAPSGASNFASGAGSPTGYATGTTNGYGGAVTTGYASVSTTGASNFAGETDSTGGVTSQNGLVTGGRVNTNFAQGQNTNFNTFGSTAQTGLFGGAGTTVGIDSRANGFTTTGFGNTIGAQGSVGLFGADNTQFTDGARPTVYNSSYSFGPGYPTSTIIPFVPRENTFNPYDPPGLNPVNSMGLTSTEHFGNQYTNQAEKSFTAQGRIPTGFAFNGRTQNNQNFNTATNVNDYSKVNLAGVTPSITLIRDGSYNNGGTAIGNSRPTAGVTNLVSSTITPANYGAEDNNAYENSQIIGSSIKSDNNDIIRMTDNFRFNGNTAANTGFRTDGSSATSFNQGTTSNQNPLLATGFTQAQNAVTPATIAQNFNTQATAVPGVVPLNNARPAVELDNTGIFGTNFAGPTPTPAPGSRTTIVPSTTPQASGYRTNEYYDNGGRGTIRYNNGLVANKITESDIPDYRTSPYTRIPNSFIINAGNGENAQSTIQKADSADAQQLADGVFTKEGFTKTGPTKTGITTAQVGGTGSYVLGTSVLRPQPDPQYIGAQAFATNFGTTKGAASLNAVGSNTAAGKNFGTSNFNTEGAATNFGAAGTSANFGTTLGASNFNTIAGATNFGAAGTAANFGTTAGASNFNTDGAATNFGARGSANNFGAAGTSANFGTTLGASNFNTAGAATNFGAGGSATNFGSTAGASSFGAQGTNFDPTGSTPNFGTAQFANGFTANDYSKSNTGANGETAGYSYPKPLIQLEVNGASTTPSSLQSNYFESTTPSSISNAQSFNDQNSVIIESARSNEGFSTTVGPIGFTTGQLENFRTTLFQAAGVPQAVTTVRPLINTGSRTVISSTPIPAVISSTERPTYLATGPRTYLDVGVSFDQGNDYASTVQGSTGNFGYSDVAANSGQSFGQKTAGQTRFANINYQQPTTNFRGANENNPIITSTQDYNAFTGIDAQTGSLRSNVANDFRSTISIPNPLYLPSSTIAPEAGVTFRSPIVAAEFSQGQFGQSSTAGVSQSTSAADFASRGSANRILSNQASANFAPQRTSSGVLFNQASPEFAPQRGTNNNGILNNQAAAGFTSQGSAAEFSRNRASANFGARESTDRFFGNQASSAYAAQGQVNGVFGSGNQVRANFGDQATTNGFFGNQVTTDFATQGQANGAFGNQASAGLAAQRQANGVFGSQGSAGLAAQRQANLISNNQATSYANQNQGFSGQTRTLIGSNVVTGAAGLNSQIIRQNSGSQQNVQILSEFNDANDANFGRILQSTTVAPEVTTYTGDFSKSRERVEAAFGVRNQPRKVVVKLSDLHPLILGKLGAECTCRADPFAVFRGSSKQTLPIDSRNRGPVDLANYDESDIYVDVDSDKENEKEIDFVRNIPSNRLIKNEGNDASSIVVSSRGEPSSTTYLPPTTARTSSTYLPPGPSNEYLPSSTEAPFAPPDARTQNRQPLLIRVEDDGLNGPPQFGRTRAGKALFDGTVSSRNNLREQAEPFDRYAQAGLRNNDEQPQAALECARPGLFRHPKFCNKFYACHWDEWKKRYTLHVFNCPVHLAFDASAGACNYPSKGPACQDNKLLV